MRNATEMFGRRVCPIQDSPVFSMTNFYRGLSGLTYEHVLDPPSAVVVQVSIRFGRI